jgi:hypothetical protein
VEDKVVLYPNPCQGGCDEVTVNVNVRQAGEAVRIQIFTTAYRKTAETVLREMPEGCRRVKLALRDSKGVLLANGLYHVVVTTPSGRAQGVIVILR